VSAPVVVAAACLRKLRMSRAGIFLHEQNAVPGKLNRLMGRFAHKVLVTFPETLSYFPERGVLVGYPLRKRIARVSREKLARKPVSVSGGTQNSPGLRRFAGLAHDEPGTGRRPAIPSSVPRPAVHYSRRRAVQERRYNAVQDTDERLRRMYSADQLKAIEEFYVYRAFFHDIQFSMP